LSLRAAVVWALLPVATAARAQQPTVSPALANTLAQDTIVTVWLMARPGIPLDRIEDLVVRLGGRVRHRSRWLAAVSAELDGGALDLARTVSDLRHIQPVARFRAPPELPSEPVRGFGPLAAAAAADSMYGPSAMPLHRLNLFPLVEQDLGGAGVTIAILDTGFETGLAAFAATAVIAQRDFVNGDSIVLNQPGDPSNASQHGTGVWSLLGANLPNQIIGVAPDADYILAKTEDVGSETRVEEDNFVAALEWADSLGAQVANSSLAYLTFDGGFSYAFGDLNGDIAVTTVAADSAAARGIVVVTAVGNDGPSFRSLSTPADGDSVIAVGAEDSLGVLQGFSSRGPTADGRLKPDFVAPGQSVFVVDPVAGSGFSRSSGTSFATPLIAGAAALLLQLHPTMTPYDMIAALRRAGSSKTSPDSLAGWGRPDVTLAATFPFGMVVTSPSDSLMTEVTPLIAWSIPGLPSFAQPVRYHLTVATDSSFGNVLLDSTLLGTEVRLTQAFLPDEGFVLELTATSSADLSLTFRPATRFIAPAWATLTTFNDPRGSTSRERRPTFRWTSPGVISPPGPFTYDLTVFRVDNRFPALHATDLSETEYTATADLDLNTPYKWQVVSRLGQDSTVTESEGTFLLVDESIPTTTLLFQNFPNPFPNRTTGASTTCIWFDLAESGRVQLDILDVRGHVLLNLVPGTHFDAMLDAGRYGRGVSDLAGSCDPRLEWDGTDAKGHYVPRGIYLVRLQTAAGTFLKRIVYMGPGF